MTSPIRVQRSRKKGWRMPPNTMVVSRPGIFGNPWIPGNPGEVIIAGARIKIGRIELTQAGAVARYRAWLAGEFGTNDEGTFDHPAFGFVMVPPGRAAVLAALPVLRGQNVACWCGLDEPCHGDPLLEFANR